LEEKIMKSSIRKTRSDKFQLTCHRIRKEINYKA
jgi:hypothetical protein